MKSKFKHNSKFKFDVSDDMNKVKFDHVREREREEEKVKAKR